MADGWVVAWNSAWLHDAYFVRSLLEAEGIEVQIPDEHMVGIHSLMTTAMGGIRVLVPVADSQRAADVLAQMRDDGPSS